MRDKSNLSDRWDDLFLDENGTVRTDMEPIVLSSHLTFKGYEAIIDGESLFIVGKEPYTRKINKEIKSNSVLFRIISIIELLKESGATALNSSGIDFDPDIRHSLDWKELKVYIQWEKSTVQKLLEGSDVKGNKIVMPGKYLTEVLKWVERNGMPMQPDSRALKSIGRIGFDLAEFYAKGNTIFMSFIEWMALGILNDGNPKKETPPIIERIHEDLETAFNYINLHPLVSFEKGKYKSASLKYSVDSLLDVAFLQMVYLTQDGKVKKCKKCGKWFSPQSGKYKYCGECGDFPAQDMYKAKKAIEKKIIKEV